MKTSIQSIQRFIRDEDGAVAIEYALLATLIALGIVVAATSLGTGISTLFTKIATCLSTSPHTCTGI